MTVLLIISVVLGAIVNIGIMRTLSTSASDVVVKAAATPNERNTLREGLSANGTTSKKASALKKTYKDTLLEEVPNGMKCFRWDDDSDHWWTHHPMWNVSKENDTHTCFQYDATHPYYLKIYKNQFMAGCSNVTTRYMWDSGWGADVRAGVATSLLEATEIGTTLAMRPYNGSWHYAAKKPDGSNPTCPAKDMTCYFLNLTNCKPTDDRSEVTTTGFPISYFYLEMIASVYNYVTRPRQWLRHELHSFSAEKRIQLDGSCAVMHVRRSDVIMHQENSRKYYPISDYVNKLPKKRRTNIFLLTDDANAIDEAHEFYPDINWIYFNRTRFRGATGGWENQIPSNSPKAEVITLLATLQLVRLCDTIVHGESVFSHLLADSMRSVDHARPGGPLQLYRVDDGVKDAHSSNNSDSDEKLKQVLKKLRKKNNSQS
jgi:hypothetical protein